MQSAGELRFQGMSLPCSIADLGPGKLDDFLEVDAASARFTQLGSIFAHPGHVYLLNQQAIKHWVLFQVEFGPASGKSVKRSAVARSFPRLGSARESSSTSRRRTGGVLSRTRSWSRSRPRKTERAATERP